MLRGESKFSSAIRNATTQSTLVVLQTVVTRRRLGHDSIEEMYSAQQPR